MRTRLTSSVLTFIQQSWLPFILLGGMASLLSYSFDNAGWVKDDPVFSTAIFFGFVIGWLLSVSCWSGRTAALYTILFTVCIIPLLLSKLFPFLVGAVLTGQPFTDILAGMNLRLWTVLYRAESWWQALRTATSLQDTGFFITLVSFIGLTSTVFLMWFALRRKHAFEGILIYGIFMAINNSLSRQGVWGFWLFIILALMLLARSSYLKNQSDWDRQNIDYPEDVWMEWSGSAAVIALLISGAALLAAFFATPEGIRALSEMIRPTKLQTSIAAEKYFAGVHPILVDEPVIFAEIPDLTNFSNPLPQGTDTIFWVSTSDPPPPPEEAGIAARAAAQHYWRNTVYTIYQSKGWESSLPVSETNPPSGIPLEQPGRVLLKQHFRITASHREWLYAVNQPIEVSNPVELRQIEGIDTTLLSGQADEYDTTSLSTHVSALELEQAGENYPEYISRQNLQVPANLPTRVRQLTDRISGDAATPYVKARRIQDYLRTTYTYRRDAPAAPAGQDFIDYFLFESQTGFCSHYASAMAIMLRLEGVPARVAAGYSTGIYDRDRGEYQVANADAHAWVEVYFPQYGWVEFEPTPSQLPFSYGAGTAGGIVTESTAPSEQPSAGTPAWVWIILLFIIIACIVLVWGRIKVQKRFNSPAERLYYSLRMALTQAGLNAGAAITPNEYLDHVRPLLQDRPNLLQMAEDVTSLFNRAVFSPIPPQNKEVDQLRARWRSARGAWIGMLFQRLRDALRKIF